jgi:hypothetical protein
MYRLAVAVIATILVFATIDARSDCETANAAPQGPRCGSCF